VCTIGIRFRDHPKWPLIVAANRDELYAREATGPMVLQASGPRIVGGRDVLSGGTWMGVNDAGLCVALTNQRTFTGPDRSLRSRGPVVIDALRCTSVDELRAYLGGLDPGDYNGFNLVYGNGAELDVAYSRPEARALRIEPVAPGIHVLPNDELDDPWFAKVAWLREALGDAGAEPEAVRQVLGSHRKPELEDVEEPPEGSRFDRAIVRELGAVCIHTERYGTRSSTFVALAGGRVMRYLFADGPPCRTSFTDYTHLLASPAS
jgi:uncharacterized protein with NRDE domain